MTTPHTPHTHREFDQELSEVNGRVLQMCERVGRQLSLAVDSLASGSLDLVDQVLRHEHSVNALERAIDERAGQIIARWQPTAVDLRLLLALVKATTDLERVGDEAKKIALQARKIHADHRPSLLRHIDLGRMSEIAREMLLAAQKSLEQLDPSAAATAARRDIELDDAFRGAIRRLISFMIEDPRTISPCLDLVFIAKSLERIGDHAKNISEYVIYAVKGKDVRHTTPEEIERVAET